MATPINPVNTYQYCISHNRENSISGFIITRDLVFKGIKFILIMELYAEHECVSGELIRYACSLHRGSVAVLSISNCDEHYGWKRGFLKLPDSMLPKKQIMTTFNRGLDSNIYQAPMKIQTGDWDSF